MLNLECTYFSVGSGLRGTSCDVCERVLYHAAGKSRPDQAQAQNHQEQQAGLRAFDVDSVLRVLRDSLFYHYLCMCRTIETIPTKLAAFGEQCPCHRSLLQKASPYQRKRMMGRFFGSNVVNCPAAGMMAAELVAGACELKSVNRQLSPALRDLCFCRRPSSQAEVVQF